MAISSSWVASLWCCWDLAWADGSPHVSVSALLMLFYLACISAVAYSLWGILLKYNPVSKVAIFGFTNQVFGVLLSAWWLGEGSAELGWNALLALILVCIGICIVNVKFEKQA